jgi:hypothetical protein
VLLSDEESNIDADSQRKNGLDEEYSRLIKPCRESILDYLAINPKLSEDEQWRLLQARVASWWYRAGFRPQNVWRF